MENKNKINISLFLVMSIIVLLTLSSHKREKNMATITDLYIRVNLQCIKVASSPCGISYNPLLKDVGIGWQANIISTMGATYNFYEDPNCSTTPVYFN